MNKDTFKFFLYRLNKELRSDLFRGFDRPQKPDDEWLEEYLKAICSEQFDFTKNKAICLYLGYSKLHETERKIFFFGPRKEYCSEIQHHRYEQFIIKRRISF